MAKSAARQTKPTRSDTTHLDDGAAEVAKIARDKQKQRYESALAELAKIGDDDPIVIEPGREK